MGLEDENGRCIRHGVMRKLDATPSAAALGIAAGSECELTLFVRNIATGETLTSAQYQALPGFAGKLVWSPSGNTVAPAMKIPLPVAAGGSCCSNRPA
jgi:hypothetical protein